MGWLIISIVGILILADLLIQLFLALKILPWFEQAPPFKVEELPAVPEGEVVEFPSSDGLVLQGSLYHQPDRTPLGLVIFCHEFGGNHWSALSYCSGIWEAGFNILAFDFRNHGASGCLEGYVPLHWLTEYEVSDVMSALVFAGQDSRLKSLPIGLFGISRGGGAALAAATRSPQVLCVACEGAFSTKQIMRCFTKRWASLLVPDALMRFVPEWHTRLTLWMVRTISQMRRRCRYTNLERGLPQLSDRSLLMISGGRDTYVLPEVTHALCSSARHNAETACWFVPAAKHNMARQIDPVEYDETLVRFFSENLREQQPPEATQLHSARDLP